MNPYIFPFNSCEIPINNYIIAQPWSTLINILNCIMILFFIFKTKSTHAKLLLLNIFMFGLAHTFSHLTHIDGNIQFLITHFTAIISILFLLNVFYKITDKIPSQIFLIVLFFALFIDLLMVIEHMPHIYNILSFILILVYIIIYYYNLLPDTIKENMYYILYLIIFLFGLQINEINNCKTMLEIFPKFPFHIIIEIVTMIPIYLLCLSFYNI